MPSDRHARQRFRPAVIALLIASLAAAARPQQQQPPPPKPADADEVLRVTTELVQTDVSVFDRDGKFVDNLKQDQFELKVDGKPQPISFFERVVAGSVDEDAQLAAARGDARRGSASPVPLDRGRVVIFFIDDFHLSQQSLVKTKAMLSRFIDTRLGQNDLMAIAAASNQLGFLSQITDDKHVLQTAAARLGLREQRDSDMERPRMNIAHAIAIDENRSDVLDYFVDEWLKENPPLNAGNVAAARQQAANVVHRRASQIIDLHSAVATRTLESLRGVMKTFEQMPGRKLVYFVSDGFALELRRSGAYDRLRQVTDAAVRAGAVVYTVDARGLGAQLSDLPSADDYSSPDPSGRLAGAGLSMTTASQEPLRTIADETGGRAILNTEAVDAGVAKALKDTSVYYLLAWKPERAENRGGKFRRVEVSVRSRPDLSVLAQRGFYATPPDEPKRRDDAKAGAAANGEATPAPDPRAKELFAALRSPFPRSGLPTALTLNYAKSKDAGMVLTASVQVEIEATKPAAGGAPPTDRVEVVVAIYDEQGKVVYTSTPHRSITPRDATVAVPDVYRVSFPIQTQLKPGLYQVRVASRDPKNRRTGSTWQWIEVPDAGSGGFSLSSVFLGVRPAPTPDGVKADAPAPPQVVVLADRRFPRNTPLRFLVYAYNAALAPAGGKPDVAVQVQVFRDDQPVITASLRKMAVEGLTDFSRLSYAAEVSTEGVPAGRYVLRVTAIDRVAKASVSRSVKFLID
ncbi:MAG TPA: VWA domain-containing protein [Pyrinomonadaceae bacterium]|jgi:VWFA-related protein|nr:VWA domain-containing protein [Pyrinomonadaceae bacterium]